MRSSYVGLLRRLVHARVIFVPVFLLLCLCAFLLEPFLGQNFFPSSDTGSFILHLRAPERNPYRRDGQALRPG